MERTRRRFWTFAVSAGAVLVILAAAASGLFRIAVQSVPGYRAEVERYVRELTGQHVRIGDLALTWRYYYPSLDLNDIALLAEDRETVVLQAERLRLGFGLTRLVRGDTTPSRLELQGLRIDARIDRDGQVTVQGVETAGGTPGEALDALQPLTRFSRVVLERCRVNLRDDRRGGEVWSFGIERAALDRGLLGDLLSVDLTLPASVGDSARLEAFFTGELLQPSTWSGNVSGSVSGLVAGTWLAPVLVRGARVTADDAELSFRAGIARGRPQSVQVELRSGPVLAQRAQHEARITAFEVKGLVEVQGAGWRAQVERLSLETAAGRWSTSGEITVATLETGVPVLEARAARLKLGDLTPWLQIVAAPASLAALDRASGNLHDVLLRFQDEGDEARYSYRARFDALALPAGEYPAGFSGLRGEVAGDERGGRAVLQESPITLELPGKLVTPTVPLEAMEAEVEWRRGERGWTVGMPQFRWRLWGLRGKGRFALLLPHDRAQSPEIDLVTRFSAEDVTRAKPLIPQAWGAGLRSWLDRSIVAGRAPRADLVIRGPLADFPFHQRQTGRWTLDIEAAGIDLAYHPDWPGVSELGAQLHFEGNRLSIESSTGQVAGNLIESVTARFPDFSTAQLLIDGTVRGETTRFYDFLARSPLRRPLDGLIGRTTAEGASRVEIHLDIPLRDAGKTQVTGTATLDGVTLRHDSLPEPIREIRGAIAFSGTGRIEAQGLTARLYDAPLQASIAPRPGGGNLLEASLRVAVDPAGRGASALIPEWLRKQAVGESAWRATLPLGGAGDPALRLESDLVGVEIRYPAPLGKARDEALALALTVGRAADAPLRIGVEVPDRLGADLKFARRRGVLGLDRGALRLGAGAAPKAVEPGLALSGDLREIDVKDWSRALTESGIGASGQTIRSADLRFGLARWSPFALREVRVQWVSSRTGWTLLLGGAGGVGEVRWTAADRGLLSARLDNLSLGYAPAEGAPGAEQVLDPNTLPLVDLDVRRLVVGQAALGHVTFATTRTELGQKTRALKADGALVTLAGEVDWRRRAGQSSATLSGDLATSDIATLLRTFGYTPNLDAKAGRFKTALSWAPSERGLEWSQAEGTVHLEFENGQLRAVEPGAGRVLGLVNFYALPRRLTLNFRDVLGSGLAFDRIAGDFELRDGSATTQNLQVAGPSVRMDVRGRIGLAARDYDQEVTVYPDVSGGVTLGAVLLGGPVAGVLALIAQEIMGKPLNQVTQLSYRVTGSWDNPQVTRGATPPPARAPSRGGKR